MGECERTMGMNIGVNKVVFLGRCVDVREGQYAVELICEDRSFGKPQTVVVRCGLDRAKAAAKTVKAGDMIVAEGSVRSREHNGKFYTDFDCTFVRVQGAQSGARHTERQAGADDDVNW